MTDAVPRRFPLALRDVPPPSSAAALSVVALLLAVVAALIASGVIDLPDALESASYWRWRELIA